MSISSERSSFIFSYPVHLLAGLLVLSALGILVVHQATRTGIGLRDDSFAYVSSAEGLVTGVGFGRVSADGSFLPLTNFPPLYPAALALLRTLGLAFLPAARLINGLAFAATLLLTGLALYDASKSTWTSLFGSGLLLASGTLYELHSWALSEALYFSLTVAAILLITRYLRSPERGTYLILAGLLTAAASLTRFIGVALLPAIVIAIALHGQIRFSHKLRRIPTVAGIVLLPLVLFAVRSVLVTGGVANRPPPNYHPPTADSLISGASHIAHWYLPASDGQLPTSVAVGFSAAILLAMLAFLSFTLVRLIKNQAPQTNGWLPFVVVTHGLAYTLILLAAVTYVDPFIRIQDRILSPLLLDLILLSPLLVYYLWSKARQSLKPVLALASLLLLATQASMGIDILQELRSSAQGFNSGIWRSSPAMEFIRTLPDETIIYTNNIPAMYFLADRTATVLPIKIDPATGLRRTDYDRALADMHSAVRASGALVVIVGGDPTNRYEDEYLAELTDGLTLTHTFRDGLIYEYMP